MTMHFDLRQLGRHGGGSLRDEHLDRTFQPSEFDTSELAEDAYKVVAPVHLVLDVHKDAASENVLRLPVGTGSLGVYELV